MDFNWILIFQIIETAALIAAVFVAIFAIKLHKNNVKFIAIRKSMIIGIYEQSKPFVNKLRETENNPNLYIEFEDFIQILKS